MYHPCRQRSHAQEGFHHKRRTRGFGQFGDGRTVASGFPEPPDPCPVKFLGHIFLENMRGWGGLPGNLSFFGEAFFLPLRQREYGTVFMLEKKTWVGKIYRECRIIWRYLVLGQDRALLEVRRHLSLKLAPRMPLASM